MKLYPLSHLIWFCCLLFASFPLYASETSATSTLKHTDDTALIYQHRNQLNLWFTDGQLSSTGQAWLNLLNDSELDAPYYTLLIAEQQAAHQLDAADQLLTDALINYLVITLNSKTYAHENITTQSPELIIEKRLNSRAILASDAAFYIEAYASINKLDALITALTPQHPLYAQLHTALNIVDALIAKDAWQAMPTKGPDLKKDNTHPDIKLLRQLLIFYGDLPNQSQLSQPSTTTTNQPIHGDDYFDAPLIEALKHYQQRHGLDPTGMLAKKTRGFLAISPVAQRAAIIQNMRRWRELPANFGDAYIMINIPDYHFDLMQDGKPILDMKVIIGKPTNQTPLLMSQVNTVIFNPYWSVPHSIAVKETLKDIQKDPTYLTKNNFEVFVGEDSHEAIPADSVDWANVSPSQFSYRFRQQPGEGNALGLIKFDFPNPYSVYMHDTSSRKLFSKHDRALSHGCIRLEKPLALAQYLLANQAPWNNEKINAAIESTKNAYIKLASSLPVYVTYWTVWVSEDGQLQWRNDLYGLDKPRSQQQIGHVR